MNTGQSLTKAFKQWPVSGFTLLAHQVPLLPEVKNNSTTSTLCHVFYEALVNHMKREELLQHDSVPYVL